MTQITISPERVLYLNIGQRLMNKNEIKLTFPRANNCAHNNSCYENDLAH